MALWAVWFLSFAVRKTFEADLDLAGSYGPFPESFSHGRTTSRADRRQSTSTGLDPPSLPYASSFTSHSSSSSTSNLDHTATPASPTSSVPLNEFGGKFDSSQSIPKMAGGVTTGLSMITCTSGIQRWKRRWTSSGKLVSRGLRRCSTRSRWWWLLWSLSVCSQGTLEALRRFSFVLSCELTFSPSLRWPIYQFVFSSRFLLPFLTLSRPLDTPLLAGGINRCKPTSSTRQVKSPKSPTFPVSSTATRRKTSTPERDSTERSTNWCSRMRCVLSTREKRRKKGRKAGLTLPLLFAVQQGRSYILAWR
jgi:hypothetical protein